MIWPFVKKPPVETGTQAEIEKERGRLAAQIEEVKFSTVRLQIVEQALELKAKY